MHATMQRYAIYYAPAPDTALARFGAAWIGRDAATGQAVAQPEVPGLDIAAATAFPRLYGFHATLKAPFSLAAGCTEAALAEALAGFAAMRSPVAVPPLHLAILDGFTALVPGAPCPALDRLAADCVRAFAPFRAPASEADRQRRLAGGLTARQIANLDRWGYPYVMEDFQFHMTLTGRLPPEGQQVALAALAPLAAPHCRAPLILDALALFHQPEREAPFRMLGRFPLAG